MDMGQHNARVQNKFTEDVPPESSWLMAKM
eukprot:SAG11_NODE_4263_length_1981_cov_35.759830_1_plen_29_part_10